jgi:hypothetical protein
VAVGAEPLVVWINGSFGAGRAAVAEAARLLLAGLLVSDPELGKCLDALPRLLSGGARWAREGQ